MIFVIVAVIWIACVIWAVGAFDRTGRRSSWSPSQQLVDPNEMTPQKMEKAIFDANVQTEIWKDNRR